MTFQKWDSNQTGESRWGVMYYNKTCADCDYVWQAKSYPYGLRPMPYICKRRAASMIRTDPIVGENGKLVAYN